MFQPIVYLLLAVAAGGNLYSRLTDSAELDHLTKPLLVPLIGLLFVRDAAKPLSPKMWTLVGGFFFSWLGDCLLMYTYKSSDYFIGGLASFLIAHVCYIFAYGSLGANALRNNWAKVMPFALPGVLVYAVLYPYLAEMALPVLCYTLAISLMAIAALLRKEQTNANSYSWVMWGSVLFMVSDTCLAVSLFAHKFAYAGLVVMLTYIAAQFCIGYGMARQTS